MIMATLELRCPQQCGFCGKGEPVGLLQTPDGLVEACDACLGPLPIWPESESGTLSTPRRPAALGVSARP